jgi:hypothetical protein
VPLVTPVALSAHFSRAKIVGTWFKDATFSSIVESSEACCLVGQKMCLFFGRFVMTALPPHFTWFMFGNVAVVSLCGWCVCTCTVWSSVSSFGVILTHCFFAYIYV